MNFVKHAEKLVKKLKSRPTLQAVFYETDGYMYATDSHVAYRERHYQDLQERFTVPLAGADLNLTSGYPKMAQLFSGVEDCDLVGLFQIENIHDIMVIAEKVSKLESDGSKSDKKPTAMIQVQEKQVYIKVRDMLSFHIGATEIADIEVHFDPTYMLNALKYLKDQPDAHFSISLAGTLRPIFLSTGDADVLVAPVKP